MRGAKTADFPIVENRHEARFEIRTPVKVIDLNRPDQQLDCVLLDVSATGLKIVAPANLPVGEMIAIEGEDHYALAEVRYAQPRGDRFTIGAERIHVLSKMSLSEDVAPSVAIDVLVEEYRNRIRDGIAGPRTEKQVPEPAEKTAAPYANRDQLLEAAAQWVVEQWEKVPGAPNDHSATRSEIVDRLAVHLAERLRAQIPAAPIPAADEARPAPPSVAGSGKPRSPIADVPAPIKGRTPVPWKLLSSLAATALLASVLTAWFWYSGARARATHLASSVSSLIPSKPATTPAPSTAGPSRVQIKATEPAWVLVTVDGKRVFNKNLTTNDVREFQFTSQAQVRVGNARGVEISVDGKPIGPIGGRGQVRVIELSPNGSRIVPVN